MLYRVDYLDGCFGLDDGWWLVEASSREKAAEVICSSFRGGDEYVQEAINEGRFSVFEAEPADLDANLAPIVDADEHEFLGHDGEMHSVELREFDYTGLTDQRLFFDDLAERPFFEDDFDLDPEAEQQLEANALVEQ